MDKISCSLHPFLQCGVSSPGCVDNDDDNDDDYGLVEIVVCQTNNHSK